VTTAAVVLGVDAAITTASQASGGNSSTSTTAKTTDVEDLLLSLLQEQQPSSSDLLFAPTKYRDRGYERYYRSHWPYDAPFHRGEIAVQKLSGAHDKVMRYAPRVVRPYLPEQHAEFYQNQPFVVAAARDSHGSMWSTMLFRNDDDDDDDDVRDDDESNPRPLVESTSPDTLVIRGGPVRGDALEEAFSSDNAALDNGEPPLDVGLLGIEFATKRRNRVNGRVVRSRAKNHRGGGDDSSNGSSGRRDLIFKVDQAFGNCPQYIQPRKWWRTRPNAAATTAVAKRATELSEQQMERIRRARTAFVATGYRGDPQQEDVRYGNDSSHRGGPAGFVRVVDSKTLVLPEYAGNNHFNTLGNLVLDDRMGVTVPDLEGGGLLQLSGVASHVEFDPRRASEYYPGALRLVTFRVKHVNDVPAGSLPIRFSPAPDERPLVVADIARESDDVKSFYLQPKGVQNGENNNTTLLEAYSAGQHLPIRLHTPDGELLRTYSLSSAAPASSVPPGSSDSKNDGAQYYRISVKRQGKASAFLHDSVRVGDVIAAEPPAGDFVLSNNKHRDTRPIVLLSAGIGVTPIFAMLQELLLLRRSHRDRDSRPIVWIQGARDSEHHVFAGDVEELIADATAGGVPPVTVRKHVAYSRPLAEDDRNQTYDSVGRIDANVIRSLVPGDGWREAEYYMCGPGSFLGAIERDLVESGVDRKNIRYETF